MFDNSLTRRKILEYYEKLAEKAIANQKIAFYDPSNPVLMFRYAENISALQEAFGEREIKGFAVDLGCGPGFNLSFLSKLSGGEVVGADLSVKMLKSARTNEESPTISFLRCDIANVPIRSGKVEAATLLGVIEHVPNHRAAIQDAARVLNNSGKLVVQFPNPYSIYFRLLRLGSRILGTARLRFGFANPQPEEPVHLSDVLFWIRSSGMQIVQVRSVGLSQIVEFPYLLIGLRGHIARLCYRSLQLILMRIERLFSSSELLGTDLLIVAVKKTCTN